MFLSKIPSTTGIQLQILDLQERVLLSEQRTMQNSYTIYLEDLSNGLYLLQLKDETGQLWGVKKFVIIN